MSSPTVPFETQNVHDDDGEVIDSFFIETDTPPPLKDATEVIPTPAVKQPFRPTKLLTRDQSLDPAWAWYLLLPPDENRKAVDVKVFSPTAVATDGVRLASDIGDLPTAGRLFHGQSLGNTLAGHTGPIYVQACGSGTNGAASATVSVEAWAVSS